MVDVNDKRRVSISDGIVLTNDGIDRTAGVNSVGSRRNLTGPALINERSGAGTALDKSGGNYFIRQVYTENQLETIYQQSWAAAKMIDIPVDDIWARGRFRKTQDEELAKEIKQAERFFNFHKLVYDGMRAGRLFGCAAVIVMPADGDTEKPLDPENVKPGEISNMWTTNRYHLSAWSVQASPMKPGYGQPFMYEVSPRLSGNADPSTIDYRFQSRFTIHHSRVIRFDGREPPGSEGWVGHDGYGGDSRLWGISELRPAVDEILRDAAIHAGIGHLVQEASLFILRMESFKDGLKGRASGGEPTVDELLQGVNMYKSIYRVMAIDKEEEAERISVNFAGLPDLMDRQAMRLAAIADIPATRFLSKSPEGMNATGSADMQNYAIRIEALRRRLLEEQLYKLDLCITRNFGIMDAPPSAWKPLPTMTEKEIAETGELQAKSVNEAYESDIISKPESRKRLENQGWELEKGEPEDKHLDIERKKAERPQQSSGNRGS